MPCWKRGGGTPRRSHTCTRQGSSLSSNRRGRQRTNNTPGGGEEHLDGHTRARVRARRCHRTGGYAKDRTSREGEVGMTASTGSEPRGRSSRWWGGSALRGDSGRLEAFSDGVLAIAVTLLILDV